MRAIAADVARSVVCYCLSGIRERPTKQLTTVCEQIEVGPKIKCYMGVYIGATRRIRLIDLRGPWLVQPLWLGLYCGYLSCFRFVPWSIWLIVAPCIHYDCCTAYDVEYASGHDRQCTQKDAKGSQSIINQQWQFASEAIVAADVDALPL